MSPIHELNGELVFGRTELVEHAEGNLIRENAPATIILFNGERNIEIVSEFTVTEDEVTIVVDGEPFPIYSTSFNNLTVSSFIAFRYHYPA